MRMRTSLMSKYLALMMTALLLWPVIPAMFYLPGYLFSEHSVYRPEEITRRWQQEAIKLDGVGSAAIHAKLGALSKEYPEAEMFWVDSSGRTNAIKVTSNDIPAQWSYVDLLSLQTQDSNQEAFTLKALIGNDPKQGFMMMRLPESYIISAEMSFPENMPLAIMFFTVCLCFLVLSFLFFVNLRKRLIKLRSAMNLSGKTGFPNEVVISKEDEIGELEGAFNRMVCELKESQQREREEEELRKQFISNISHDLRTPLTVIRQHVHSVRSNPAASQEPTSLSIIDHKLDEVDKLMDNLLSYSLLSAGKYPINIQSIDITEEVRNRVAEWYPIFEAKDFDVVVELPDCPILWNVDPMWLHRIMDNVFQNVVRHAGAGRYIGIQITDSPVQAIIVKDKGPGTCNNSPEKGAGIGLSIVSMMTREMGLHWELKSEANGSTFYLWKDIGSSI